MIKKVKAGTGRVYRLYTSDGSRPLSNKLQTKAEAERQERAIEASKARRGKK